MDTAGISTQHERRRRCRRRQHRVVPSRCGTLVCAGAAALPAIVVEVRAAGGSSSTDADAGDVDDGSDDDSGGGEVVSTVLAGAQAVLNDLQRVGDAVLIRRKPNFWSGQKICKNAPFVLSKDGPSNMNCPDVLNRQGFSCTCLNGFIKANAVWEFHVATKAVISGTPALKVASTSTLKITKIAPLALPQEVTTVRIVGHDAAASKIDFLSDVTNNGVESDVKLMAAQGSKASLTLVHVDGVDMESVVSSPSFFPASVKNLTLRNCNLKDDSTGFLLNFDKLMYINLENNALTKIPTEIFNLPSRSAIYLKGNRIVNGSLTESEFKAIQAATVFEVDIVDTVNSSCTAGVIKTVKGTPFCVTTSGQNDQTRTDAQAQFSSGSNTNLIVGIASGCSVVVVLLIFLIVRRRSARQKEDAFVKQQTLSLVDETTFFDHSKEPQQSGIDSSLLNDPIIITHRIPFNDVKVATCISRGGFGLVYSGTFNRRRVAIKRIRSELSADIKYIEAFLKEICLMASLSHPRIVEFVGVAWDSLRNLSAVTEFMERGDLRDVLHSSKARNAPLTWDGHKVRIAMHIAEALTYLHSLSPKVIHRDLKSKNVLLDSDMTAKLSDFGVSRERRFEETHMTAGIGTAFWIAPEVLLGMDYDERADIFSFGVVLSEIDTDDYPYWNEKNPASGGKQQENVILRMVATGALRPEFSPSCPGAILELAQLCLDVDPLKRPTAAEIAYRLQQLIRSSPLTPQSVASSDY